MSCGSSSRHKPCLLTPAFLSLRKELCSFSPCKLRPGGGVPSQTGLARVASVKPFAREGLQSILFPICYLFSFSPLLACAWYVCTCLYVPAHVRSCTQRAEVNTGTPPPLLTPSFSSSFTLFHVPQTGLSTKPRQDSSPSQTAGLLAPPASPEQR